MIGYTATAPRRNGPRRSKKPAGARSEGADGSTQAEPQGPEPVGVVLAGGRSLRMGKDKALLELGGEPLVALAARRLARIVQEVVIADAGRSYLETWPSISDGPGAGPVAGLLGAAARFPGRCLLALACDLPNVTHELLALLREETSFDWVVPEGPRGLEPLCARYGPRALACLESRVAMGRFELWSLAEEPGLRIRRLSGLALGSTLPSEQLFANLNRPGDLPST
ncbi:MAG: molybdenum cofactor guanylyltransferase [Thermoanaerobaculia bacterium]